jgi:AcrR family transcriptional regulator
MEAALRLFVDRGYVATSVESIALEAGVAPATVYQAFGTKQGVLARALDTSIAGGATGRPLLEQDWVASARRRRSARGRLEVVVRHAAQVAARTAPLKQVMRDAAATDPRVRELIREDHERRRTTQRALVEVAVGDDRLRPGMTTDRAAATFFLLVSSGGYELARDMLGWTEDEWRTWLLGVLTQELFGDASP